MKNRLKKHQPSCQCGCTYIPPHILDNLARSGIREVRLSVQQSEMSRSKRSGAINDVERFAAAIGLETETAFARKGQATRKVYDCQHRWDQRFKLVRSEGDPPANDDDANLVYEHIGIVRDYFRNVLGRNSIDNLGMDLILNVHFGRNYMNAFWDGDEMTFGDGDGQIFTSFAKSLDVTAHELVHGVTQFTANLNYENQSGALNEHFSDVFGTAISQYANGQSADDADWLIGDEIMGPTLYGEALRCMSEPGTAYDNPLLGKDPQPAHMKDYYSGPDDNGGVHINSGILNKAFYLVAMDIGTDKATLIWYDALQKLWPTANFNDAVSVLVTSAQTLTRDDKVPCGSTQTVRAAFKSVGLPA